MSDNTTTTTTPAARPHVRAGSIAWGLIVIAAASLALWVSAVPARRTAVADWVLALTPGDAALVAVLACGAIVLIAGVLAAIRRAQKRGR